LVSKITGRYWPAQSDAVLHALQITWAIVHIGFDTEAEVGFEVDVVSDAICGRLRSSGLPYHLDYGDGFPSVAVPMPTHAWRIAS
jgi:hypothetical protein